MNNILNQFLSSIGGQAGLNNKLNELNAQCQQQNISPESYVRNMLNSGQISQGAFNQAAALANMLTGRNK